MKELIKRKALEIGFDAIGFTAPSLNSNVTENFDNFISNGFFGDMEWMAKNAHRRRDPKLFWPEARSIIVVACTAFNLAAIAHLGERLLVPNIF